MGKKKYEQIKAYRNKQGRANHFKKGMVKSSKGYRAAKKVKNLQISSGFGQEGVTDDF